jgi:hypothetical protein
MKHIDPEFGEITPFFSHKTPIVQAGEIIGEKEEFFYSLPNGNFKVYQIKNFEAVKHPFETEYFIMGEWIKLIYEKFQK